MFDKQVIHIKKHFIDPKQVYIKYWKKIRKIHLFYCI